MFYTAVIESVLCTSITVWFGSATKLDKNRHICDHRCQPAHHPRPVHLQSQETGRKNHCSPLTPRTQTIQTPPLWWTLQITVRQNLQTQKQFLPPRRLTTEQLTHCSIYIYIYIFIPALLALSTSSLHYCCATFHSYCI